MAQGGGRWGENLKLSSGFRAEAKDAREFEQKQRDKGLAIGIERATLVSGRELNMDR